MPLACVLWIAMASCQSRRAVPEPATTFPALPDRFHLQNAHVVTAKVISGAQPEGDESFKALRELGVRTIVSVDGAKPDVETAHRHGLTYVHLPITYAGVPPEQGKAIAKALDELPGPIYLHCHHGQHRSAAAVAVACVYNGSLPPERAESVLQTFGTGENYKGLWRAAREARPLSPGELRDLNVEFVETRKIPPLAEAMVLLDERWDHLKTIKKAGWQSPTTDPDLDPRHEALQVQELLHEIGRTDSSHANVAGFNRLLGEAELGSKALRDALSAKPANPPAADAAFARIGASCAACHKAYRD